MNILAEIKRISRVYGADVIGFADLSPVKDKAGGKYSLGISMAVALNPLVIKGISTRPSIEYHDEYVNTNKKLDILCRAVASHIRKRGFAAVYTEAEKENVYGHFFTDLPHKTVATLSGLGWIGKCSLLVTKKYGSAVRLASVITDIEADLPDNSIRESLCGVCNACVHACPAGALTGIAWRRETSRHEFFDADACVRYILDNAVQKGEITLDYCGVCMVNCPFTQKYIERCVPD